MPAEGHRSPGDGHSRQPHQEAETPLAALRRLRREAEARIEQLIALLDEIKGDPDLEPEPAETDLSSCENVSQLVLNGDDREDDDDGEPSLAVPETRHWDKPREGLALGLPEPAS
jgi:hypothetical protein